MPTLNVLHDRPRIAKPTEPANEAPLARPDTTPNPRTPPVTVIAPSRTGIIDAAVKPGIEDYSQCVTPRPMLEPFVSQAQEILILKGLVFLSLVSLAFSAAFLFGRPAPCAAVYFVDAPQAFLKDAE